MMDWEECKKRMVKSVSVDTFKIKSIQDIANNKIDATTYLPEEHSLSKITLLYDALREFLESFALSKGFKIYNHECYTYFLKEIVGLSDLGNQFDSLRKIRNKINYYGKTYALEESQVIITQLNVLIKKIKQHILNS